LRIGDDRVRCTNALRCEAWPLLVLVQKVEEAALLALTVVVAAAVLTGPYPMSSMGRTHRDNTWLPYLIFRAS
jgi:hypothetical protein